MMLNPAISLCLALLFQLKVCHASCTYESSYTVTFGDGASQVTDLLLDHTLSDIPIIYETSTDANLSVTVEHNSADIEDVLIELTNKAVDVKFSLPLQNSRNSAAATTSPAQLAPLLALSQLEAGRGHRFSLAAYSLYLLTLNHLAAAEDQCAPVRIRVVLPKYRCATGAVGSGAIGACAIVPQALEVDEEHMQINFIAADGSECSLKLERMNPCFTPEAEIKVISHSNSSALPIPTGVATYANENCSITIQSIDKGRGIVHLGNDLVTIELKDGKIYLYQIYFNFSSCEEAEVPQERRVTRRLQTMPVRFDNCFTGDSSTWNIKLGIVVTQALLARFDLNHVEVLAWLEEIVSNTNHVYGNQMSINFIIDEVVFHESRDASSGMEWNGCATDPYTRLYSFATWVREQSFYNRKTLWHMFGNCFTGSGVIGIAYIQALCTGFGFNSGLSNYDDTITWISFAHEAGHNIGATHGTSSGIMSGGTQYGGIIQFNPHESKGALCGNIQTVLNDPTCSGVLNKVTDAPTSSPTASPSVPICESNNRPEIPVNEREAQCTTEPICVWSSANGGECYEIKSCFDFNQFKEENNGRQAACLGSQMFQCGYSKGECNNNFLPLSVLVSTCEENNDRNFAAKDVRESGCTWDKGCLWNNRNGGECYKVSNCEDINQFKRDNGARKTVCRETAEFPCNFGDGTCSTPTPTQSPVVTTCEQNNVKSFAPKSVRESGCTKEKGCAWSSKNRGECFTVSTCDDYNQFKRDKGSRKTVCLDSDFDCAFSSGRCFAA